VEEADASATEVEVQGVSLLRAEGESKRRETVEERQAHVSPQESATLARVMA
jgi:hypothetical protein